MPVDLVVMSISILFNLVLLTVVTRLTRHYNALTKGIDKKTLTNALQGIQQSLALHEHSLDHLKQTSATLARDMLRTLRPPLLKRFNPFGDTGGDQSFVLGLLDGHKDGIVITSLHSRENTRFYIKSVKGGAGVEHPLSTEEQKTIAQKSK